MEIRKKIANFVIRFRFVILGIFLALAVAGGILSSMVKINYDLAKYLPNDSQTKIAVKVMEEQYGASGTACVMVQNITPEAATSLVSVIAGVDGVSQVAFDATSANYYNPETHCALYNIFLQHGDFSAEVGPVIEQIRAQLSSYDTAMGGAAVSAMENRAAIMSEVAIILLVVIAIVLGILTLTARSWLEPLVYLIVIGVAILINMGTNLLLGEISYITQSISAIMLIALEMDYCIVLCSRFREEFEKSGDAIVAMRDALAKSFLAIVASSATVIAGLAALMFMKFTIGFDMGLVLAKGVLIGVLSVIFFMPCVILLLSKLLQKTAHRSFLPKMDGVAKVAHKTRHVVPAIFLGVIVAAFIFQTNVPFTYVVQNGNAESRLGKETALIEKNFGHQNSLVIMVPTAKVDGVVDEARAQTQLQLYNYVTTLQVDGEDNPVNLATSMASTFYMFLNGEQLAAQFPVFPSYAITLIYTSYGKDATNPNDKLTLLQVLNWLDQNRAFLNNEQKAMLDGYLAQYNAFVPLLESADTSRMIFNINLAEDNPSALKFLQTLTQHMPDFYLTDYHIASETLNTIETMHVFEGDRLTTDLIIVIGIFLIVLFAFRSISIPALLVLSIQGAIWINLAFSTILNSGIFFVCYLLAMAIQMGATIDYAILLTDRYKAARQTMPKRQAMARALNTSITTILTSGLILILAAFSIGIFSSIPLLSQMGMLIGRGALISVIVIIFVLPQVLMLFDKLIEKTTLRTKFLPEDKQAQLPNLEDKK